MNRGRLVLPVSLSAAVFLAALVLTPMVGTARVDFARAWAGLSPDREIFFYARLPRVLLSILGGGALSVTGVVFQALLRDALAEPYTLGISSGASLGAVLAICFGWRLAGPVPAVWLAAFVGASVTLLAVMSLAMEGRRMSSFTLLLAGVTVNSMAMAVILFLHNVSTFGQSFAITRWLMGGIDAVEYSTLAVLAVLTLVTALLVFLKSRDWNLLAVGDDWAAARGVDVPKLMLAGYVAGSVLTGSVTALTGPIGFVGLIVPHALRMRLGADHRVLIPCSFLLGAAFLAVCDMAARTLLAPSEIPVGVITALLGGPFFLWLLRSKRRSLWL